MFPPTNTVRVIPLSNEGALDRGFSCRLSILSIGNVSCLSLIDGHMAPVADLVCVCGGGGGGGGVAFRPNFEFCLCKSPRPSR